MHYKKPVLALMICAVIIIALLASLHFISLTDERTSPQHSEGTKPYVRVYATDSKAVELNLKNTVSSYTLRTQTDAQGEDVYLVAGIDAAIPLYNGLLSSYFSGAAALNAYSAIEEPGDLVPYGLDRPSRVEILFADGSATTLLIGSQSPDSSVYVMALGDNLAGAESTVYLAELNTISPYLQGPMDFVYPIVTAVNVQGTVFETAAFSGGKLETPVVIRRTLTQTDEQDSVSYNVTEPVSRQLDRSRGLGAVQALFGITADEIAVLNPDETALEKYGLLEPYTTVLLTDTAEGDITLYTSAPDSAGKVYLLREGIPVIYRVPASVLSWVEMDTLAFLSKNVLSPSIGEVASIELVSGEIRHTFILSGEGEEITVSADGGEIPQERFRPYYQTLSGALIEGFDSRAATGDEQLRITYRYRSGGADTLVYSGGEAGWRVLTDSEGFTGYLVSSMYVQRVLQDTEKLISGETVTSYYAG